MRGPNIKMNIAVIAIVLTATLSLGLTSCTSSAEEGNAAMAQTKKQVMTITEQEVSAVQKAWGEGIVKIGKIYSDKGDYSAAATEHINNFYNYQEGSVLFKPTLTSEKQFRTDFEGALSYFVGGNDKYKEDNGFAIKPWSNVRWENIGTKIMGNMAVAMGNYYFTPAKGGDDVKVEYSFGYTKDKDGNLKIILHGSHIPYQPAN